MDQGFMQIMPLILIGVVFYFLLIRPQQKRVKDHKAMVEAVRRGDSVVTAGGLMGKVVKVREDNVVQVELAPDVKVDVVKSTLSEVRSKTEPAPAASTENKDGNSDGGNPISKLFKK